MRLTFTNSALTICSKTTAFWWEKLKQASSAKRVTFKYVQSGRSLIYNRKSGDIKEECCETPQLTNFKLECALFTVILKYQFVCSIYLILPFLARWQEKNHKVIWVTATNEININ